jgi:hypothetical protein
MELIEFTFATSNGLCHAIYLGDRTTIAPFNEDDSVACAILGDLLLIAGQQIKTNGLRMANANAYFCKASPAAICCLLDRLRDKFDWQIDESTSDFCRAWEAKALSPGLLGVI